MNDYFYSRLYWGTHSKPRRATNKMLLQIILIELISVTGSVIAIYFSLRKLIFYPLIKLMEGVKLIAKGNFSHKVDILTDDELGEVALAFNGMSTQIKNQINELQMLSNKVKQANIRLFHLLEATKKLATVRNKVEACLQAASYVANEITIPHLKFIRMIIVSAEAEEVKEKSIMEYLFHVTDVEDLIVIKSKPQNYYDELLLPFNPELLPRINEVKKIGSAYVIAKGLCIPIIWANNLKGFIELLSGESNFLLNIEEEMIFFANTLASSLGLSMENIDFLAKIAEEIKGATELEAASAIQKTLLPTLVDFPGIEIVAQMKAAAGICGDWYGYHYDSSAHNLLFTIGDVTGHGISAALMAAVACGASYSGEQILDATKKDLTKLEAEEKLLRRAYFMNKVVLSTGARFDRIITMNFISLNLLTGEVFLLNAGHVHPYHISKKNKSALPIINIGNCLGYNSKPTFSVKSIQLEPGDAIFIYTDGLIENKGPNLEMLTTKILKEILTSSNDIKELDKRIYEKCNELWKNKSPEDDVTTLIFQWNGPVAKA